MLFNTRRFISIISFFLYFFFFSLHFEIVFAAYGERKQNEGRISRVYIQHDRSHRSNDYSHDAWYGNYNNWYGNYTWPSYYAYYGSPVFGSSYYYSFPLNSTYYFSYPSYYTDFTYPSYPYNGFYYTNNHAWYYHRSPENRRYSYERNVPSRQTNFPRRSVGVFLN